MWLEDEWLFFMTIVAGPAEELLQLVGGVMGHMALDLRANSLLWNSKTAGRLAFLIGTCRSKGQIDVFMYICSLQSQCAACVFWIRCRFDNFEFAEGEKSSGW